MSRVYFHTRERTVGIGGRERASFGMLCWRMTEGILNIGPESFFLAERLARFREMVKPGHYTTDKIYAGSDEADRRFSRAILTAMHVDDPLVWNGRPFDTFALSLNTALALGSDAVKLAARIHGQCEIHAWVGGPNRARLAGLIERGLADGVFHSEIGQPPHEWPDVVALLREDDQSACVLSYSVCEQFPSLTVASAAQPGLDRDAWYDGDLDERWSMAMAGLRASAASGLELRPDDWADFRFSHKLSAVDLAAEDWRERLDAWAAPAEPDRAATAQ